MAQSQPKMQRFWELYGRYLQAMHYFKKTEMRILTFICLAIIYTSCNSQNKEIGEVTLKLKSQKLLQEF